MPIHRYCYRVLCPATPHTRQRGQWSRLRWLRVLASASPAFHNVGGVVLWASIKGSAPPPSRSLRGVFVRRSTAFERTRGKPATQPPRHYPNSGRKPENCLKVLQGVWRSISEQFLPWRVGLAFVSQPVPPDTPQDYKQGLPCNYRPTETRFRWSIVDGARLLIYS